VRYQYANSVFMAVMLTYSVVAIAGDIRGTLDSSQLPPIETFLLQPADLENVSIWVPAEKAGPVINRSCGPKRNRSYSCVLRASVHHTKTKLCPKQVARLLAEYVALYHERSLPLTIFNGWQWEYSYTLCQFESVTYDLPARGGCWENSWEALLSQSVGAANFEWLQISPLCKLADKSEATKAKSLIEVRTFSSVRTRNGYPKERQL
jgi:hypothetical protein